MIRILGEELFEVNSYAKRSAAGSRGAKTRVQEDTYSEMSDERRRDIERETKTTTDAMDCSMLVDSGASRDALPAEQFLSA